MTEKANIQVNTTLMGEKLLKGIKYLEEAIKHCNIIIQEIPNEIKIEKSKYKKAKLNLELGDITLRKEQLETLLADRKKHFENDFMPKHEQQLKDCEKEWDYYIGRVKEFVAKKENKMTALALAYQAYLKENPDDSDEEMKIGFYQGIKQAFAKIDKPKMFFKRNK